ncbi:MAG: LLM class flavin-dependent oxidoreductase [Gammaproteobacteria bacterium]|nr:LLM class flavin-dependent oxidoreductase [Gammaproteobacteria bacterium]
MLTLSVLDQSPIRSGGTSADALNESIALARHADRLGYHRYWVAEHHGSRAFAGCAPEILISRIAAETSRIRVGSGGVMLPHYSPYKVAETFKLLEALYPGRIDLGIGRAPGSDYLAAQALAYGSTIGIEYFHNKLGDLKAFLEGSKPMTRGLENIWVAPETEHQPELWVLGSSHDSAVYAAHFGLPYSFAHFIAPDQSIGCLEHYRNEMKGNPSIEARGSLGVFVLCAEKEEEVADLRLCRDIWRLRFEKGDPGPCPSIEEAKAVILTEEDHKKLEDRRRYSIAGTPDQVKAQLEETAKAHGVNELIVVTICHKFEDRARSYELLADAFGIA